MSPHDFKGWWYILFVEIKQRRTIGVHPQDGYDIGDELSNISVIFEEYEEVEPILDEESFDA